LRVMADFSGNLFFSGISQHNASRGLFDEGSSGAVIGDGSFRGNSRVDLNVSGNKNAATSIRSLGSTPFPFYPSPPAPKSGMPAANATGTNCMVYIISGKIHGIAVDGINLGSQTSIYLPVGKEIAVKYNGTLAWVWQRVM
jgi:hypothetical protein